MEVMAPITAKYTKDMHKMASEEFLAQVDALAVKHHGDKASEEFTKDYKALINKYVPTYRHMVKELHDAYKKAGYPTELVSNPDWDWE